MAAYPRCAWRLAAVATRGSAMLRRHAMVTRVGSTALSSRWLSTETDKDAKAANDTAKSETAVADPLPPHLKFRMPDLNFQTAPDADSQILLSKWLVKEGDAIRDDCHMCEIDTPDLSVVLDSGDEGFLARILVPDGTKNVPVGKPLAIIVPTQADIPAFKSALKLHPNAIEGYVEPTHDSSATAAAPQGELVDASDGSDVLRQLHKLHKEGKFTDERVLKMLRTMARKNDEQLLIIFKGSFDDDEVRDDATFDADFFVQNAVELALEALEKEKNTPTP